MKIPKDGSVWNGATRDRFRVLNTVEIDGHTWVHYIKEDTAEPREYSCYVESFLERFRELPE